LADYLGTLTPGMTLAPVLAARAEAALRDYLIVGGMPEAVGAWLAHHDIAEVEAIQQSILDSYLLDMAKHAPPTLFPRLEAVWRSIPRQLAKPNDKFIFSQVMAGARAKDLEDALEWLVAANIALKVPRVLAPGVPLSMYADDRYFKLYVADVGLLRRLAGVDAAVTMQPSVGAEHFRGALAENYVLTQLVAAGVRTPYFWRSDNTAEIDFLVQIGPDIIPLEVQAGRATVSRSMAVYKSRYSPAYTLKLTNKPTVDGHLPLTAAWDLPGYVGRLRGQRLSS